MKRQDLCLYYKSACDDLSNKSLLLEPPCFKVERAKRECVLDAVRAVQSCIMKEIEIVFFEFDLSY